MPHSAELVAAVVGAKGRKTASVLAAETGLTRNAIIGIWGRHALRPSPVPADDASAASDPRTAVITGRVGAVWRALVAAGDRGCSSDELRDTVYGRRAPATWVELLPAHIRSMRRFAGPHGLTVGPVTGAKPKRWRVQTVDGPEAAPVPLSPPVEAVAPPATPMPPPQQPAPIAPALQAASPSQPTSTVLDGLAGAAAAVAASTRGSCRWPLGGHPNEESFRFCGAPARDGKPYCADHVRAASAGVWTPRRAA